MLSLLQPSERAQHVNECWKNDATNPSFGILDTSLFCVTAFEHKKSRHRLLQQSQMHMLNGDLDAVAIPFRPPVKSWF